MVAWDEALLCARVPEKLSFAAYCNRTTIIVLGSLKPCGFTTALIDTEPRWFGCSSNTNTEVRLHIPYRCKRICQRKTRGFVTFLLNKMQNAENQKLE
jgi:hypothetical protein